MRASYCESNSPVTTSQRKAGKPRTRSYIRHHQAGNPIWPDVEKKYLGTCRAMRKMEKNKVGGGGELLAANFKTLSPGWFWAHYHSLHLGKNKIGLSKRMRILNLMERAKITFSILKANIKCWGISHYFVFSTPLLLLSVGSQHR